VKELFTEQQLDWIVMGIAVLATLISLGWGFYETRKLKGSAKKALWANAILFAFTGPAIWLFWGIYNSIENYYGLDSVKALEINFGIVIGIAVFFIAVQWLISRLMPRIDSKRRRA
jgi:divalent metal cation (Fe/Co/Zn/Cd) transporter